MSFIKGLKSYSAFLYPCENDTGGRINLYCEDQHRLYLIFQNSGSSPSANTYDASDQTGVAYRPISHYEHYIDLIRNEAPIWVTFNPDSAPPSYAVHCGAEPPGDGEM